jgi:hypothetical protein
VLLSRLTNLRNEHPIGIRGDLDHP